MLLANTMGYLVVLSLRKTKDDVRAVAGSTVISDLWISSPSYLYRFSHDSSHGIEALRVPNIHHWDSPACAWVRFRPDVIFKPHNVGPSTKNSPTAGIT